MEEVFYTFNICIISLINLEILHCRTHTLWWVLVNLIGKILCYRMRNIRFKPRKKKKKQCPNLMITISNHHRVDVIRFERNDAYVRCMRYMSVLMAQQNISILFSFSFFQFCQGKEIKRSFIEFFILFSQGMLCLSLTRKLVRF